MRFRLRLLLSSFLLLSPFASSPAPAADSPQDAELDAILTNLASARTVQGRFVQTRSTRSLRAPIRMRGEFCMTRGAFAWHIQAPAPFSVVIQGDRLQQWDAISGRTTTIDMTKKPALSTLARAMQSFASGNAAALRPDFDMRLLNSNIVSLTPKPFHHAAPFLKRLLFELDDSRRTIRRMRIEETNGDSTDIVYSAMRLNEPIAPSQWNVRRK